MGTGELSEQAVKVSHKAEAKELKSFMSEEVSCLDETEYYW